jgi:hypothetical protein
VYTARTPLVERLCALADNPTKLRAEIAATPRPILERLLEMYAIDDEHEDPDPWPCWCGQVWGCNDPLDVRLKGMLFRLTDREAIHFMRLAGIDEEQTGKKRRKLLGRFFIPCKIVRRKKNRVLAWFHCLIHDMPNDRCEEFLLSLKIAALTFLDRRFRRPPLALRKFYLPNAVAQAILARFPEYVEPPAPGRATRVCPGKAKVSVFARRRGEGDEHDSAQARANGRLYEGLFSPGDITPEQLEKLCGKIGRRGKHLGNGATVAGSLGREAEIQAGYAAEQAAKKAVEVIAA